MISDDVSLSDTVGEVIQAIDGLELATLARIESADRFSAWDRVALVVIDIDRVRSDATISRLLRTISEQSRPIATLTIGDGLDSSRIASLLKMGVAECLIQPIDRARLAELAVVLTLKARSALVPTVDESVENDDPILTQVRRIANQNATILLEGETGTGKTRLARKIHEMSGRRDEPFVVINCGSMSAAQLECSMFGHARGSLEGTLKDRMGKFAEAGRGTLFLDEIDELPPSLQPRLLRVVEDRLFEAGETGRTVPVEARLIAATNRDLEAEVESGQFRSDLYFRLNVIGLRLPPLRERRSWIAALASKFLAETASRNESPALSIAQEVYRALEEYDWPGNIRELRNTIERAVALATNREILVEDLPVSITRREVAILQRGLFKPQVLDDGAGVASTLAEIKRDAEFARITQALEKHSNNRLRAASELGISRMTLYKKLYKYGLMNPGQANHRAGH